MADDVDIPVAASATIATDEVSGRHFQRIKLTDPTDESTDPIGVPDNPMTVDARMAFVDWDDSIVPVTDNDDNHWLPVAVRNTVDVNVTALGVPVAVYGSTSDYLLTGPSDGTWGTEMSFASFQGMVMLYVKSTGGTPTVAAFAASQPAGVGGVYDQQLPLVVPDGDSLVLADTFTPGAGARFCYLLANPPYIEIRAVSGGTSDPVDAVLTANAFSPPITATVSSGGASGDTELTTKDYDTGGGTDTQAVVGILLPKSGGAVAGGTSTDPLRTDPTGTTTQPVSAASLPLPSGAATSAKQPALGTAGSPSTDVISVQGVASGTAQPVSGTVTADTELPAAAALADGASNPTTPTVGAGALLWNGTGWDRVRGDTTNGVDVDVTRLIPGTGATNLGKAEDDAHVSGDTGVAVWAVRQSDANSLTPLAGSNGDYIPLTTDTRGTLQVLVRPTRSRLAVASSGLTTASTTYTVGDTAGTLMTFANAAKVSGGTGIIRAAMLLDEGDVGTDYRLHIFRASVTLAADNAAWAVSDTDQRSLIGIVIMPSCTDVGANRVSTLAGIDLPYDCNATSLFVGIETRSANAVYAAATDLYLALTVDID